MYRSLPTLPKNHNSKATNPMIVKTTGRRADRASQTVSAELFPYLVREPQPGQPVNQHVVIQDHQRHRVNAGKQRSRIPTNYTGIINCLSRFQSSADLQIATFVEGRR